VVGILHDKDAAGIIDALSPIADVFFVTQSGSDRAIDAVELEALVAERARGEVRGSDTLLEALDQAREWAADGANRAVLVTGSITLVGDAMRIAADEGWKK
jgi:dihydrofolate synthase / folylpolyglutamate synthase